MRKLLQAICLLMIYLALPSSVAGAIEDIPGEGGAELYSSVWLCYREFSSNKTYCHPTQLNLSCTFNPGTKTQAPLHCLAKWIEKPDPDKSPEERSFDLKGRVDPDGFFKLGGETDRHCRKDPYVQDRSECHYRFKRIEGRVLGYFVVISAAELGSATEYTDRGKTWTESSYQVRAVKAAEFELKPLRTSDTPLYCDNDLALCRKRGLPFVRSHSEAFCGERGMGIGSYQDDGDCVILGGYPKYCIRASITCVN